MKLLVSACLLGIRCRYDGGCKPIPCLKELNEKYTLIPVCPECLGGLSTPRVPAERIGNRVLTREGTDVTANYRAGAEETLRIAEMTGCTVALLKARSPSCGCGEIYDGTFSGNLCPGDGVTAALLKEHGITVLNEDMTDALPKGE